MLSSFKKLFVYDTKNEHQIIDVKISFSGIPFIKVIVHASTRFVINAIWSFDTKYFHVQFLRKEASTKFNSKTNLYLFRRTCNLQQRRFDCLKVTNVICSNLLTYVFNLKKELFIIFIFNFFLHQHQKDDVPCDVTYYNNYKTSKIFIVKWLMKF